MIYFIQERPSGHIKIGFSANPWLRLNKMRSDCPGELTILGLEPGEVGREAELHAQFAAHRLRGEWFAGSAELVAYAAALPPISKPPSRTYRNTWGESGLTDGDLAPLVGVSRAQLCRIRRRKSQPSLPVAVKIQQLTGIPAESFCLEDVA